MTPQERELIVSIGDAIRANPVSWDTMDSQMQATVMEIMRPKPSFTPDQREFLNHWWLQVDDAKIAAINAKMPRNTVVSARLDNDGGKWISADMFTDAVESGMRLAAVFADILTLKLHYHESSFWPVAEDEVI